VIPCTYIGDSEGCISVSNTGLQIRWMLDCVSSSSVDASSDLFVKLYTGLVHESGNELSSSGRNVFNVDRNNGTVVVSVK
jgi:hypothetical protein